MSIEKLSSVWPEWKVIEQIGEGAFGKVYKAVREEHSMTTYSAIKVITIPQSNSEVSELKAEGLDDNATITYFKGIVDDFINEIKLMESMKGMTNVVSVEDFKVLEKEDAIGWDIFIRMELLTPFNDYSAKNNLSEKDVIKLGIDICNALELCAQKNIIHRDIKPENIFVSSFGDFKVGDFGIAKELEKTNGTLSSKGTYSYMAPEVVMGKKYNSTVDTYSLGLVLYKLLNNNRLPFIDPNATQIQYQERKSANDRRLCGEQLPAPINASQTMSSIILKACAFNPDDRFASASELKNALISVQNGNKVDFEATVAAGYMNNPYSTEGDNAAGIKNKTVKQKRRKGKKAVFVLIAVIAVVLIGGGIFLATKINKKPSGDEPNRVVESVNGSISENDKEVILENYEDAKKEYDESGEVTEELINTLNNQMEVIFFDFKKQNIDYYTAKLQLEDIADMKITEVQDKLDKTKEDIEDLYASRQAFDAAQIYEEKGEYTKAISEYRKVTDIDVNYETAKKKIILLEDQYRTEVLDEASELAEKKDYIGAVDILNNALENVLPGDTTISKQVKSYQKDYVNDVINKSNKLLEENKYDEAVNVIEEAQEIVEDNSLLADQLAYINNQRPKNFIEVCKPYDQTMHIYEEFEKDCLSGFMMAGEECKNGFKAERWFSSDGYILSNLNGEYSTLSFKLGHVDGSDMVDTSMVVYLDGEVENTYEIYADAYPKNISIDVTGVNQIKFYIPTNGWDVPTIGFADMIIK